MYPKPNNFFGIGASVFKYSTTESDYKNLIAFDPMDFSPADLFGLRTGDLLISVDGTLVKDISLSEAVELIKGPAGTKVDLEVHSICENQIKNISVERGPITVFPDWVKDSHFISLNSKDPLSEICNTTDTESSGAQALYIPLSSFSAPQGQDLCEQFLDLQIKDLMNPESIGLIVDLRGNPGGSLDAVSCMLDTLISSSSPIVGEIAVNKGEIFIDRQRVNHRFRREGYLRTSQGEAFNYNKEVIVLVDGGSASASEIFAGVIQETKRGWVVGERTIGKGTVQTYQPHFPTNFKTGSTPLVLGSTTAIYTLPSGRSPQQYGIVPDFHFSNDGEEIAFDPDFVTVEEKSFGSLVFENKEWVQNRPAEIQELKKCLENQELSHHVYRDKLSQDDRYARPFVSSFQLDLAKDILLCSPERDPLFLTQ